MPGSLCCAVGCWHQNWKKTRRRRSRATQNSRKQHKPHEFYVKLNARRVKTEFSSTWCHLWCGHKEEEPDRPQTTRAARWSSPLPSFMWPHRRFAEPKIKCPHQNKLRRHASPAGKTLTRRGPSLFLSFRALRVLLTVSTEASILNSPSISHRVAVFFIPAHPKSCSD